MPPRHTTLRLEDALMRRAKAYAREHDLTLTTVMERALHAYLAEPEGERGYPGAAGLPVFRGTGLRPGVTLDDTSALLDLMDGIA